MRDHEPAVARAGYDFTVIEQPWLRDALKWQLKTALETGLLRWASVLARLVSLTIFSQFIAERGIDEPRLYADRAELRLLALDFLAHVKQRRARCGANRRSVDGSDRYACARLATISATIAPCAANPPAVLNWMISAPSSEMKLCGAGQKQTSPAVQMSVVPSR